MEDVVFLFIAWEGNASNGCVGGPGNITLCQIKFHLQIIRSLNFELGGHQESFELFEVGSYFIPGNLTTRKSR